jgi:hypothetical protein
MAMQAPPALEAAPSAGSLSQVGRNKVANAGPVASFFGTLYQKLRFQGYSVTLAATNGIKFSHETP